MRSLIKLLLVLVAVLHIGFITGTSIAIPIVENLSEIRGNSNGFVMGAQKFTTGASPVSVDSIDLQFNDIFSANPTVTVSIWNSAGLTPASSGLFATVEARSNFMTVGSFIDYTFTALTPISLLSSTEYWVVALQTGSGMWATTNSPGFTGTGILNNNRVRSLDGGVSWVDVNTGFFKPNYMMSVNTSSTPVPEPATIALLGIGLAGLGGSYLRRRRKKIVD